MRIFLGGTCNDSNWRDILIELSHNPNITYFNPVVPDWTPECQQNEIKERQKCDIVLYTITPEMTGVYSVAEVVDDSNKRPNKTILCLLKEYNGQKFTFGQWKSLLQVGSLVQENGGHVLFSLMDLVIWIEHLV